MPLLYTTEDGINIVILFRTFISL